MAESIVDVNELDPNKKGEDYCRRQAKEIHTSFYGQNGFFFNQRLDWARNRKYARGEQPINNAKQALNRDKNISYDNLSWKVPKAIPIIFDIMVGIISKLEIDIQCDSIDPESVGKKMLQRYKAEAEIMIRDQISEIEGIAGIPLADPNNQYGDIEELEIDVDAGMFKLDLEIAMKEAIEALFDFNKLKELDKTILRYGANCGLLILRHYVQNNGLIKIRPVNPEKFVSDFVSTRDFRDMGKCGEYVDMNMAQLRQISNFKDEEYIAIATAVANKYGNPTFANLGSAINDYRNTVGNGYIFDKFIVRFLYAEWSTTNRYNHVVDVENPHGNKRTKEMPVDFEHKGKYKEHSKNTDYLVWYKCSWILDTDFVFDCGPVEFPNVKSNALNESQSTFAVCAVDIDDMKTMTYTERVIDQMDLAFLSWMQYQSHLCKAVPPGVAADLFALTNIPNGRGGTMQPLDVLERFTSTGNLLLNTLMPNGAVSQRLPIEILNGSDFSKAVAFYQQFLAHIEAAKMFLGINEFVDASNPNPEQSVGGAKLAVQGTNNSLQPLISARDLVYEKVAEGIVNRCQHMAEKGQLNYMTSAIGRDSLMILSVSSELSAAAFGIKMGPRMDFEDKAVIQADIQASLAQRTQTGVGGIEIEDAIAVRRLKDPKAQERLLMKKREQRSRKDMERASKTQEDNAMVQERSIVATKQAEQETMKLELDIYTQKKEIDLQYKEKELALTAKFKDQNIITQGQVKDENIVTQGMVDKKLQAAEPKTESKE